MESPASERTRRLVALLVSVVAVAIAASGLVGGFVWDDARLVGVQAASPDAFRNAFTKPFFDVEDVSTAPYYRPVVSLALALQARLFGAVPFGYHVVSLLLELACAALVLTWLERRLAGPGRETGLVASPRVLGAAALGALLFVVHPSRPQVVSWISGSTDLWAGLFALSACVVLQRRPGTRTTLGASVLLALATMSKETAVAVPFALLLDEALTGAEEGRRERLRALGAGTAVSTLAFLARGLVVSTPLGAIAAHGAKSLVVRVLFSLGWELEAILVPTNPRMQLNYDLATLEAFAAGTARATLVGAVAALGFAALLAASRSRPALRPWTADLGFFFVLAAPSLNVVPFGVGTTVSERFVYLPLLGFSALLARSIASAPVRSARVVAVATSLVLTGLALVSARETTYLRDERTLQEHFHDQDPTELLTLDKLFRIYAADGDVERARRMNAERLEVVEGIARRSLASGADVERVDETRTNALLVYVERELGLVDPSDGARLASLRAFLEAVHDPAIPEASLEVRGRVHRVRLSPRTHRALSAEPTGTRMRRVLVVARTLTLDLDGAETIARELASARGATPEATLELARVRGFRGDFVGASETLAPLRGDPAAAELDARCRSAEASMEAARLVGPRTAIATEAVLVAQLGLPARGRALLEPLWVERGTSPTLVDAAVQVELAARAYDRARALVERAIASDPARAEAYRGQLARIEAAAGQARRGAR